MSAHGNYRGYVPINAQVVIVIRPHQAQNDRSNKHPDKNAAFSCHYRQPDSGQIVGNAGSNPATSQCSRLPSETGFAEISAGSLPPSRLMARLAIRGFYLPIAGDSSRTFAFQLVRDSQVANASRDRVIRIIAAHRSAE